jgi:hypothetical protein
MKNDNFEQKTIGRPDAKKEMEIINLYQDICRQANDILFCVDSCMGYPDKDHLDPSVFFEFMNSKDPMATLYSNYIALRGITFPGINISRVIELGLAEVPLDTFTDFLGYRNKLLKSIQSAEVLKFHFPLINLWHPVFESFCLLDIDDQKNYTFESAEFESRLYQHTRNLTGSEADNLVLEAIEKAVESMNDLIHLGIIKNNKGGWITGIANLSNAIVFNNYEERPLSVNPMLNRHRDFRRFFAEPSFNPVMGQPQNILKFDGLPINQPEAIQENISTFEEIAQELPKLLPDLIGEPS